MRKIRNCVSSITNKQCETFRKASTSVQPLNIQIYSTLNTHDVIKIGSQAMKDDGFILIQRIENI